MSRVDNQDSHFTVPKLRSNRQLTWDVFCWCSYHFGAKPAAIVYPILFFVVLAATLDIWFACQFAMLAVGAILLLAGTFASGFAIVVKVWPDLVDWLIVRRVVVPILKDELRLVARILLVWIVLFIVVGLNHYYKAGAAELRKGKVANLYVRKLD